VQEYSAGVSSSEQQVNALVAKVQKELVVSDFLSVDPEVSAFSNEILYITQVT